MDEKLLLFIRNDLGQILDWKELCPGVYSLNVQPDPDGAHFWSEYYLTLDGAPISREARALGRPLLDTTALLYPIDPPAEGGWTAVMYELCEERLAHGVPPLDGWALSDAAMEGMELCPAYFGSFPVPHLTPWGWTLRHRPLDNGIYCMETDPGKTVLAVCNPVCYGAFRRSDAEGKEAGLWQRQWRYGAVRLFVFRPGDKLHCDF